MCPPLRPTGSSVLFLPPLGKRSPPPAVVAGLPAGRWPADGLPVAGLAPVAPAAPVVGLTAAAAPVVAAAVGVVAPAGAVVATAAALVGAALSPPQATRS